MMKVVEIKQELNDTSFEQEIFDISKLSVASLIMPPTLC